MNINDNGLVAAACAAREQAYAPYSNFAVGAAVQAADGRIFTGVNVENASYGLTICAERTAVFKAVAAGVRQLTGVAICTSNGAAPCGACRQVLVEFAADIPVWLSYPDGRSRQLTLHALLPDHFGPEMLGIEQP